MRTPHPPFVVVEGPNGVGKSTVTGGLGSALGMTELRYPDRFLRFRQEVDLDVEVAPLARLLYYLAGIADLSDTVAAASDGVAIATGRARSPPWNRVGTCPST